MVNMAMLFSIDGCDGCYINYGEKWDDLYDSNHDNYEDDVDDDDDGGHVVSLVTLTTYQ